MDKEAMKGKYFLPRNTGKCLGCGGKLPAAFLDLGEMPLANSLIKPENLGKKEARYRLAVSCCPQCHLVQITHRVDPEILFSDYLYFSSYSDAFVKHAAAMVEDLTHRLSLNSGSLVMEIASNDGYLLQFFKQKGIPIVGIEPAKNIAKVAVEKGIPTLNVFFGPGSVRKILEEKGQADVIIGNNVLAHVPQINDFLSSVNQCLKPQGSSVFEFPYLKSLIEHTEFDTIYHEHVFYYSLNAIKILAERASLQLYDVQRQDIHGGSLRVFLQKEKRYEISSNVKGMLADEEAYGITDKTIYNSFGEKVALLKAELVKLLRKLKQEGKTIAAYGAAAKGNILLNYMGINNQIIDFVVDRSTYKQGLFLPGTRIPILHQDELLKRMPYYTLVLAWNFAEEIMKQQNDYHQHGGKFIIPIPEIRVV
jgi:SAM-dependent methyltransferase